MIARLALFVLLVCASRAGAAPLPFAEALPWARVAAAHAGDWAEYAVRVGEHPVGPWLRFRVLGSAPEGGTWIEVWISERPGSATQAYRLLVDADGRPRRVVARLLGGASRELELPDERDEGPPSSDPTLVTLGEEPVQTGAGTLLATRVESRQGPSWVVRAWVASEVPVFGLARIDLPSGTGLELSGWGRGGKGVVELPATGSAAARPAFPRD